MATRLLPSATAAARAGIKPATLYAYVSRGLVTAHERPGHRGSWFDPVEIDALTRRARGPAERPPDLRLTSSITLIERGAYWYRGESPTALAQGNRFEEVAEWLWTGERDRPDPAWPADAAAARAAREVMDRLPADTPAIDRVRVVVAVLGAHDRLRFDLRPAGALATARRLVATTAATFARRRGRTIAEQVASWLASRAVTPRVTRAIDTALIVMADHELAASTLAVRVAASFRADPYAAVVAGLGAMGGSWHGAASRRVEDALRLVRRGRVQPAAERLLDGTGDIPGFGHPLYPGGDPRVDVLLPLARTFGATPEADALAAFAAEQGWPRPNVDFALAVLAHRLRLAPGAGEALFTMGRLAGWLAHAQEEYADRTPLRLRAVYAGPRPD